MDEVTRGKKESRNVKKKSPKKNKGKGKPKGENKSARNNVMTDSTYNSRMCLLTGRQAVSCEYAIQTTRSWRYSIYGTRVTDQTMKMQGKDAEFNMVSALRDAGYFTGMVGKWGLMTDDSMKTRGCNQFD